MRTKISILLFSLVVSSGALADAIDLNDWTAESYPAVSGFGAGSWAVSPDGSEVTQTVNGQPTLFYSDFNAFGTAATGTVRVTAGDDDYIGFALGFLPGDTTSTAADYLLVDWKKGTQDFNFGSPSLDPGGTALEGLAVSRVTGVPSADEFWQHATYGTDGGLLELARGSTLGSTGWVTNTSYDFTFDFGPSNLLVFVDGILELDIAGSFGNGRLGFYNFSQAGVNYAAFEVDDGSFPVPEPGMLILLTLGLAGLRIRSKKQH